MVSRSCLWRRLSLLFLHDRLTCSKAEKKKRGPYHGRRACGRHRPGGYSIWILDDHGQTGQLGHKWTFRTDRFIFSFLRSKIGGGGRRRVEGNDGYVVRYMRFFLSCSPPPALTRPPPSVGMSKSRELLSQSDPNDRLASTQRTPPPLMGICRG